MRIMTARKLTFYSKDRSQKFTTAGNRVIEDCPDWAEKDSMFVMAEKAGILTRLVLASSKAETKAQEAAPKNAHEAKKATSKKKEAAAKGEVKE